MKKLIRAVFLVAILLLTSCKPREPWDVVILGDSFFGRSVIAEQYADFIAEDLGVEVNLHKKAVNGQEPEKLLANLRSDEELRQLIRDAEAVVFDFSPGWSNSAELKYLVGTCKGDDNQDCLREALESAKADWIGLVNTIADLRDDQPVILRIISWGDWVYPAYYGDTITPDQFDILIPYFHEYQSLQASIPGVGAALAFAEDYEDIPAEYFTDGLHLSDAGSAAVVDLLRNLGYEPAVIEGFADLTFTFTETGCAVTPLEGAIPNPIYIRVENPTDGDNALLTLTLKEGYGVEDILAFGDNGLPPFMEGATIPHYSPGKNAKNLFEVPLVDGRENYLVCAQDGVGALAVPLILKP